MIDEADEVALELVLGAARDRGFVGATVAVADQITHALAFAAALVEPPERAVDLGSGGGLPGLVLAATWPDSSWGLVDAQLKRTDFLDWAVTTLGWSDRVTVRHGRAEDVAREVLWRGSCDLVVARSFGPPAVVAECAAGFLRPGGRLVVSEPPEAAPDRWGGAAAVAALDALGMAQVDAPADKPSAIHLCVLEQRGPCPDRFPRRAGVPEKRPLF